MEIVIITIYGFALLFILLYSIVQFKLVINYRIAKRRSGKKNSGHLQEQYVPDFELPTVTIQLPVYNEIYVVKRLIDTVIRIDYPPEKLEIQVLDDSNDETSAIAEKRVKELLDQGHRICFIHRNNRRGFKAGALEEGLKIASGEFIAIFDADFVPPPDFLHNTLSYFENEKVGMVQTRWGHINKDYSLLTRLQAFGLDAHFSVEQKGRNARGHFINFNGTAGIWRKKCILDAGGWEHDTLTEDLDLSYRAQMKGWKFKYLEEVVTPAELPVVMSAVKNQQFRWNKGGAENFRKMIGKLIASKQVPFRTKVHGFFHLLNSAIFLCVLTTALLSVPLIFIKKSHPEFELVFNISSLFLVCTFILMVFYWNAYQENPSGSMHNFGRFFKEFVLFLATTMGLSFHNSVAVIEGYLGKKSSFVRTPKFNIMSAGDRWSGNKYLVNSINLISFIEGLLCLYFLFAIIAGIMMQEYGLLPFHLMLCWGFGFVFFHSIRNYKLKA
ncbi:MAG: cellulose synthase family protein [Bacteroidota bacterium]|nr:cellulose synthase family protein [Bacteroidota bacterium]